MRRLLLADVAIVISGLLLCVVPALSAEPPTSASLGAPDFRPTPDRPVGWRGDWTGRYPGANPPTTWSRRVKGITSQISYQADKPHGAPADDSHSLEYFTTKDWLVAGPFQTSDAQPSMDHDFLGGEQTTGPEKGGKAGELAWKPLHVGIDTQSTHYHNEGTCGDLNVDFVYVFSDLPAGGMVPPPKGLDNKVAYAHTYLYVPDAGDVMLRLNNRAAAIKAFLNGQAVALKRDQPTKVALQKGWNRLLVKASSAEAAVPEGQNAWVSRWRFAAYLEPVLPVSYETRNVAWMTKLTGRSMSQPIVVGDRLYLGSGMTDLLCLDKGSGKILWLRSNTPYDGLAEAQRAALPGLKETIEPLVAKLETANAQAVEAINAAVSPSGLSSDEQIALDKLLKAKADAERALHLAFRSIDKKQYPPMFENEVSSSNPAPASDGKFVYWVCGGGMKGPGAQVISCFDLDGKRIWSRFDSSLGSPEHGNHISPALVDGKLIYSARGTLVAYDTRTGEELWRNHPNDWQNEGHGSTSPVVAKIGDTTVIVEMRYVHRASDGVVICPTNLDVWGVLTPIVEGQVMFNPCHWRGWKDPVSFAAVKLPPTADPGAKPQTVLDLPGKDVTMPIRMEGPLFMVASPLYVNGIVYSVEMGAGIAAVDTRTGKSLYRERLDGYDRYNRYLFGVAASPTLGGSNIYVVDDAGYTHIIQPGPRLVELNRNVLENIHLSSQGGNPCKQECFFTSPAFDGKSMYLRGEEYLYCIGNLR